MTARLVVLAAAVFAIICVLAVGRNNSSGLLITLFVLWVFAPFVMLALLIKASRRWAPRRQLLLQRLSLFVCAASTIAYGLVAFGFALSKPAFWFLVTPLASLSTIAIVHLAALKAKAARDAQKHRED
jgi:hypothetical protein